MAGRDPSTQVRRDRNDLVTGVIVGAVAVGLLSFDAVQRILVLFGTPGAVTVSTRVPAQEYTALIGPGTPAVVETATLTATDVNTISVVSLVVAIMLRSLCLIAAATLSVMVCLRLLRGVVFDRVNSGLTFAVSMSLMLAGLLGPWFENMGLNGVFAALGGDFGDGRWLLFRDGIPLYIAAIAVGVLVIVFRRGADLQKDTEGLV
ncbi:hypothetical protein [Microbacterium sp. CIAB417]|uniref:hypothetical protein n=1 Tax=Microbacterium sp. CIAB417 TaxID=2860287 RepID=UPI001FACD74A|nr:hypothetical protein [Microbacterium sp. CIAB417]